MAIARYKNGDNLFNMQKILYNKIERTIYEITI